MRPVTLLVSLLAGCSGWGSSDAPSGPPPEVARPYDETADAEQEIAAAVAAARGDGKRVLLVFGANWCSWCRRL